MKKYILLSGILLLVACGKATVPKTQTRTTPANTSDINRYQEDLASVRPTYTAPETTNTTVNKKPARPVSVPTTTSTENVSAKLDVTSKLDVQLDTLAVRNRAVRYAQGYRIQIYVGADRREAESAKSASYQLFPEITPYLIYSQPNYRVKVGDFLNRIEAERFYERFKEKYPTALVVPDRVDIRKNVSNN